MGLRLEIIRSFKLTLRLSGLEENVRDDLVDLSDEFEERVLGEVLEGELSLSGVSGVLLSELHFEILFRLTVFRRTA